MSYTIINGDCLIHHGIKGQKWGVRRFQNEDGSLTEDGRRRYNKENFKEFRKETKRGREETSMTKRFFNANKDLSDRMSSVAEKARVADSKYYDIDNATAESYVIDGENSKRYKNLSRQREKAANKANSAWEEKAALWDEMLSKGQSFLNENLGEYKNKKISGLNVRGGKNTVEKLFFSDIEQNWYKHVKGGDQELDDWTR